MLRAVVALSVMALSGVAYADWHEVSSDHFVVYADDAPERVRKFADDLERFDQALRVLRRLPDEPVGKANRLNVYVLDSVADIRELADDRFIAGFYTPRAGGSVAFVPRRAGSGVAALGRRTILFHEYTHHLMSSNMRRRRFPPGWSKAGRSFTRPRSSKRTARSSSAPHPAIARTRFCPATRYRSSASSPQIPPS